MDQSKKADNYEEYDYEADKLVSKGGRNRSKTEVTHTFSANRSDGIHLDSQNNNRDKQMEATRKKSESGN